MFNLKFNIMQIRKYQNSGKLDEGEIHVNIDPVTITPEP